MENKITSHIVKGSILSGIAILMSIIVNVFNLYEVSWVNYINYAIMIGGLIYSCILFANENDNKVSFGNIFAHGFKTTSVVIVITVIYTFLSLKLLFPDMQDKILEISRKKMAENPQMTDEMIDQAIAMTKKFFLPFAIGGAIIGTGFIGAISSLIGAGVAKKIPVDPFAEPTA
ncbi:MAG: DUF4199 domain-containing protein [Chitinophagia bacterium]|jgi:Protein of unknown function (DUF4199)